MNKEELVVKKYVVRLSTEECETLEAMLRRGKHTAQHLTKARILLKADVSKAGEGWSDHEIIEGVETSASMVYRVRKQRIEEGFEAVFTRKKSEAGPVERLCDGEKEAQLLAWWCGKPPAGRARWSLRLLEKKVVELKIVDAASRSTIGRVLKKYSQAPSPATMGYPAAGKCSLCSGDGGYSGCVQTAA